MRAFPFVLLLSLLSLSVVAQEKVFNLGGTIGFNSAFPIIRSIAIDGVELENIRLNYKVGNQASIFGRINVDRFFIQPSISWQHTEGEILFDMPQTVTADASTTIETAHLEMSKRSLQAPVYIGYHIVRQGPYALSFLAGPTLKYNYSVTYKSQSGSNTYEFINEDKPLGLNVGMGVSVQIWQLFFDFCYEFGLNQTETDFRNKQAGAPSIDNSIRIDKRTNLMSFSLGIIF